MDEQQRFLLVSNKTKITEDLLVGDVLSFLQSKFVLNIDDVEMIKNEITSRKKASKLLSILLTKKKNFFTAFYEALQYAEYPHLAELLQPGGDQIDGINDDLSDGSSEGQLPNIETILQRGGVPALPDTFVKREECIKELNSALERLSGEGWVVLHGMGGTGKTLLASSALHNETLVHSYFPGGIFWVYVGKVDEIKLLMKMQNLCFRLDTEKTFQQPPRNLEEARDRLRVLYTYVPYSLLVLDDLWSNNDARYFDVRARILVTSRYAAVADKISGLVIRVPVKETLTPYQSKSLLSSWTGLSLEKLPAEANDIIKASNGCPLALSMIGSLLKKRATRWGYYLQQLQEKKLSKIKGKLSYCYDSLYDAIEVSVQDLSDDLYVLYQMLAVFEEDVTLSTKLLSIYFDLDTFEVEDITDELTERSLLTSSSDQYNIHDLQLTFLKEKASNDNKIFEYHNLLVDRYRKYYANDIRQFVDDAYIYWYYIHHLLQASRMAEAISVLKDFVWLEKCIKSTGPVHVISLFNSVIKEAEIASKEEVSLLRDLARLVSVQAHNLLSAAKEFNLLQISLSQPTSEDLYQLALSCAQKSIRQGRTKWYYNWSNRPMCLMTELLLTNKPHESVVHTCQFACGNGLVVSGGGDMLVKIWSSVDGKEVASLKGHSDTVNSCCFTPDDRKVVSCSSDATVKVWSVSAGQELMTLHGHKDAVLFCSCSWDNRYIVTSSVDAYVMVWDMQTGFRLKTFAGHTDVVNCCCFSRDCNMVASASNDTYLKLWSLLSEEPVHSLGADKDFVSYCVFSPDDQTIVSTSLNFIQMYSKDTGVLQRSISAPCDVVAVQYSPDGNYLAVSNIDMTARLLDISSETFVQTFTGHSTWLNDISFSFDGTSLMTACADGVCRVWSVHPGSYDNTKLLKIFDAYFSSNEEKPAVFTVTNKATVKFMRSSETICETEAYDVLMCSCCISPDGTFVSVGFENGNIKVLDLPSLAQRWNLILHRKRVTVIEFGQKHLVAASDDNTCSVWNLETGALISQYSGHKNTITYCQFFDNENKVVSSSFDGFVTVWDAFSCEEYYRFNHDQNTVFSFTVAPDQTFLATCTANSTAWIWSLKDGSFIKSFDDHDGVVRCVTLSHDGNLMATGCDDGTVRVWNRATDKLVCEISEHEVWVVGIYFNDTDDVIMTVSNNLKWFDLHGTLLQTYRIIGSYLGTVKCTPDFAQCITIDDLGHLYLLNRITDNLK